MVMPSKSTHRKSKNLFVLGFYEFLVNLEGKILRFVKLQCGLGQANKDPRFFKLSPRDQDYAHLLSIVLGYLRSPLKSLRSPQDLGKEVSDPHLPSLVRIDISKIFCLPGSTVLLHQRCVFRVEVLVNPYSKAVEGLGTI